MTNKDIRIPMKGIKTKGVNNMLKIIERIKDDIVELKRKVKVLY